MGPCSATFSFCHRVSLRRGRGTPLFADFTATRVFLYPSSSFSPYSACRRALLSGPARHTERFYSTCERTPSVSFASSSSFVLPFSSSHSTTTTTTTAVLPTEKEEEEHWGSASVLGPPRPSDLVNGVPLGIIAAAQPYRTLEGPGLQLYFEHAPHTFPFQRISFYPSSPSPSSSFDNTSLGKEEEKKNTDPSQKRTRDPHLKPPPLPATVGRPQTWCDTLFSSSSSAALPLLYGQCCFEALRAYYCALGVPPPPPSPSSSSSSWSCVSSEVTDGARCTPGRIADERPQRRHRSTAAEESGSVPSIAEEAHQRRETQFWKALGSLDTFYGTHYYYHDSMSYPHPSNEKDTAEGTMKGTLYARPAPPTPTMENPAPSRHERRVTDAPDEDDANVNDVFSTTASTNTTAGSSWRKDTHHPCTAAIEFCRSERRQELDVRLTLYEAFYPSQRAPVAEEREGRSLDTTPPSTAFMWRPLTTMVWTGAAVKGAVREARAWEKKHFLEASPFSFSSTTTRTRKTVVPMPYATFIAEQRKKMAPLRKKNASVAFCSSSSVSSSGDPMESVKGNPPEKLVHPTATRDSTVSPPPPEVLPLTPPSSPHSGDSFCVALEAQEGVRFHWHRSAPSEKAEKSAPKKNPPPQQKEDEEEKKKKKIVMPTTTTTHRSAASAISVLRFHRDTKRFSGMGIYSRDFPSSVSPSTVSCEKKENITNIEPDDEEVEEKEEAVLPPWMGLSLVSEFCQRLQEEGHLPPPSSSCSSPSAPDTGEAADLLPPSPCWWMSSFCYRYLHDIQVGRTLTIESAAPMYDPSFRMPPWKSEIGLPPPPPPPVPVRSMYGNGKRTQRQWSGSSSGNRGGGSGGPTPCVQLRIEIRQEEEEILAGDFFFLPSPYA